MKTVPETKRKPPRSAAPQAPSAGDSSPVGATPCRDGVNFSEYSKHATGVELLLFDGIDDAKAARVIRSIQPPTAPTTTGMSSSPA